MHLYQESSASWLPATNHGELPAEQLCGAFVILQTTKLLELGGVCLVEGFAVLVGFDK